MRTTGLIAALTAAWLAAPLPADAQESIPLIVKSTSSYYFSIVAAGAKKAATEVGVRTPVLGPTSFSDIQGQISILENTVAAKPLAVVITPLEFSALGAPIDEAANSVPVVTVDSAADARAVSATVTTDNVEAGRQAAVALAQALTLTYGAAEGKVATIVPFAGQSTFEQRMSGFKEKLAADYPRIELVTERIADGQAATAVSITTDLLTAHRGLRGVLTADAVMGAGAAQAVLENSVQDKVRVVSFDNDEKLVELLANGGVAALVVQDPYRMGYEGIKTAYAVAKGKPIKKAVDTGVTIITQANMGNPRARELLNPKID